jgi:hypothetical protein
VRVLLAGGGADRRETRLEGLAGATRVAEVLRLGAEALGVPAATEVALRLGSRQLRGDDTLAEAGVPNEEGVVVSVSVGEAGGMPGGCFGFGGQQQVVDDLHARVREAEAESRRHAAAEAQLQAEVERLRTSSGTVVKEVPVEKVMEVVKEVPVEKVREVVKEVPVEKVREVVKEVPVEKVREVVKEVPVEKVREVVKVVPVEKAESHLKAEVGRLESSMSGPRAGHVGQLAEDGSSAYASKSASSLLQELRDLDRTVGATKMMISHSMLFKCY